MKKKILSLMMALIILMPLCGNLKVEASAISAETMKKKFEELKKTYPEGSTWNGSYKNLSWQCMVWAETVCDYLFGENPRNWAQQTNWDNMCVGDHVRLYYKGEPNNHSIVITNMVGNTIYYADCNGNEDNKVHWNRTMSRSALLSKALWFKSQPDNWVRTLDNVSSDEQPVNLGDSFYAVILNKACWKPLEVQDDGWVLLASEKGIARQVWRFNRESDGSYKIATTLNGNVLDVQQSGKENGSRVGTYTDKAGNNQRWFIYAKNGGYTLKPKHADKRLDLNDGNSADGTKLQIWDNNSTDAQIFAIYKSDDVQLKSPTLSASVNQSNSKVTFDWSEVYGEGRYDVKIWKNNVYQGDAYHIEWGAGHNYSIQLPPGYYEAYVDASNAFECKMSNVVGFTIPAQSTPFNLTCTDNISTVINNTSSPQTVTIAIAEYSNGALSDVHTQTETFTPNETKTYSHAASARVFVWDSLTGMRPLAK